jgi:hypothetical protein
MSDRAQGFSWARFVKNADRRVYARADMNSGSSSG